MTAEPSLAIFFGQIVALIVCGRLVGELMERIRQPAVMGQLIGGMLLGPSVFGACFPTLQDRKSTRLNSSHVLRSRMPSSA